jgi:P-type Ca2+ transporter type 2C
MRRDPTSGLTPPILTAVTWSAIPVGLLILSTEPEFLQNGLLTQSLTGLQWLACIGLALVMPLVVEVEKWIRRRRLHPPAPVAVEVAVAPARAVTTA